MDPYAMYSKPTNTYQVNYVRNSKAIGVLWGLFTVCFAIVNVLVFLQSEWLGNDNGDYVGLYKNCLKNKEGTTQCTGDLSEVQGLESRALKAATVLVGISALSTLLAVACLVLFVFVRSRTVYIVCGTFECLSFFCFLSGCLCFAGSWDTAFVRTVCPSADLFHLGQCKIRWTFVLAIIGVIDAFFLTILAFVLAFKQIKIYADIPAFQPGDLTYGHYGLDSPTRSGLYGNGKQHVMADADVDVSVLNVDRLEHMSQFSTVPASSRRELSHLQL